MRRLIFTDIGKASKIIKKLNLRANADLDTKDAEALGASLFLKLIENYSLVEGDIAEFMGSMLVDENISKQDFLDLEMDKALGYILQLKEDEGYQSFFSTLSKMAKGKL